MQVSSHLYYFLCLLECLQLCSMPDVLEVRCVLPEVLLDFGVEGMVGGDHQGRMVAHLAKVLQCLMGRGEGEEDGRWGGGRGRMYCFCVGGCSMYAGSMCVIIGKRL